MNGVSVVIPTYNCAQYVAEAVESALRQTCAPLEVIVVDDGSTDGTLAALRKYMDRIRYIRLKNRGVSAARNTGIRAAQGDWIAFLDADDAWLEDKLRLQMHCAEAFPPAGLLGALAAEDARFAPAEPVTLLRTSDLLGALPFGTSSVVAKKEILERAGLFDENRHWAEDRELWLKASRLTLGLRVNRPLWVYRLREGQKTSNSFQMAENYRAVLRRFFAEHPALARQRAFAWAYFHYDSALAFHETGNDWKALGHILRSLARHPSPLPARGAQKRILRPAVLLKALLGEPSFRGALRLAKRCLGRDGFALPAR